MDPTFSGFQSWLANQVQVPADDMPPQALIQTAYDTGLNLALCTLQCIPCQPTSPSIYAIVVYCLGTHFLVLYAPDQPNPDPPPDTLTFWSGLRTQCNVGSFVGGVVASASDQGTSESMSVPQQLQNLTLLDLGLLQTPWGQQAEALMSSWGNVWGIS